MSLGAWQIITICYLPRKITVNIYQLKEGKVFKEKIIFEPSISQNCHSRNKTDF